MNIFELIYKQIIEPRTRQISINPNEKYENNSDEERKRVLKAKEYKTWYIGEDIGKFYRENPDLQIFEPNRADFFYANTIREGKVKEVHSSIPNAIVSTLVNAIGEHKISYTDQDVKFKVEKILEENDFTRVVNQEQLPLTLVQGWGAFKVDLSEDEEYPTIEFYDAERVDFITNGRRVVGVIFKNYYKVNGKDYLLLETRSVKKEVGWQKGSYVEYSLFKLGKNNELTPCDLNSVPGFENLKTISLSNYNKLLAVPVRILYDPLFPDYGRSIFAGKVDLFDDLDQILSQASQTVRVSTPVEYYPTSLIGKNKNGFAMMPKVFNRQFIQGPEMLPNGDGDMGGNKIITSQPVLNFSQYSQEARDKLDMILTGLLSPASMGIDIAKKDNAEAQREKEKVTIMTRNNIINTQGRVDKRVIELALDLLEFRDTGTILPKRDYGFSVSYDDFANPTFEQRLSSLSTAYAAGAISAEKYVDLLWGDDLSQEEKSLEVSRLKEQNTNDFLVPGEFENESMIDELPTIQANSEE